jgi:isoleucyl-tRNA synthetase
LIDNLTNWYIRFNRKRLKGTAGTGPADTLSALNTLFDVLFTLIRALAPFIPFITDHVFQMLLPYIPSELSRKFPDTRSVHFTSFPEVRMELFDENVQRRMSRLQKVIDMSRTARDRCNIPLKTPLLTLVILADGSYLEDIRFLSTYIREELNVRNIILTSDEEKYEVRLRAVVADWSRLGKKLKKDVQKIRKALPGLTNDQLKQFLKTKTITIDGIQLGEDDLTVARGVAENNARDGKGPAWESNSDNEAIVLLDPALYPELMDEGAVRELINRFQRLRKKGGLVPTDDVAMEYSILDNPSGVDIPGMIEQQRDTIRNAVRRDLEQRTTPGDVKLERVILEDTQEVNNVTLLLRLLRL